MDSTIEHEYTISRSQVLGTLREPTRTIRHNGHEVVAFSHRNHLYNLYYRNSTREYGDCQVESQKRVEVR